ncbi:hypothetical protein ACFL1U_02905 [Patescibacteria group bacterium]
MDPTQTKQNDGSGIKVVSWLLAILLLVALIILSEYVFYQIRTSVRLGGSVPTVSELYEDNGGTIEYRAENDLGEFIFTPEREIFSEPTTTSEITENNQEVCDDLDPRRLNEEYSYYDYGYYDYDTGRTIDREVMAEDLEYSYYAACIDLDVMATTLNQREQLESENAFQIPLRQLWYVIPFFIVGILIFLFVDRKSKAYRAIGFPYLGAVLWVGIHFLIELGIAIYKIAPEYGVYVILGAVIILLSGLIWWLQNFLKKRQAKAGK